MVMDAQPSPLSVGREFVRQYYTLLNKAPNHLHRFYNNHSSFIHGGDSQNRETVPVVGQKNIYNRIQQLNFRDCHAKISQVDAQATLGNGVVVQVTGELSNDGQPMRRFTQTFVLAPQSPKNYYVHNDIFRYQDLYSDDDNEQENRSSENDDEHDENKIIETSPTVNQQNNNSIGQQQQPIYYQLPTVTGTIPANNVPIQQFNAQQQPPPQQVPPVPQQQQQQQQVPQVNGVVHDEILQVMQPNAQQQQQQQQTAQIASQTVIQQQPPQQQQQQQQQQPPQPQPQQQVTTVVSVAAVSTPVTSALVATTAPAVPNPAAPITPLPIDTINKELNLQKQVQRNASSPDVQSDSPVKQENDVLKKDDFKTTLETTEKPEAIKIQQSEPKTYANLFKSINTNSTSSGFVSLPTPQHQNMLGQSPVTKQQELRSDSTPAGALPQRTNSNRQSKDFSERRVSNSNSQYSDSNQLFFGNVPHHATEEELRVLFNKFGPVVELRLHSKTGSKVPGVRVSPNYGFVTYEDLESVQNCLSNCPLYFPDNSPDGQKLNVEEKKIRQRNNANDINRLSNNMSGNSGMGNSQRSSGGPNRSLSNSAGGLMRGNTGGGSGGGQPRGSGPGGPRPTGNFPRNDRGTGSGGGPQSSRQTGNNSTPNTGSANSYGRR